MISGSGEAADSRDPAEPKQHDRGCQPDHEPANQALKRHGVGKGGDHSAFTGILR